MMSYTRFVLENPHGKSHGHIRMRIRLQPGKYYRSYIGEKIPTKFWLPKSNRVSASYHSARSINRYLDSISSHFDDVRRQLTIDGKLTHTEMDQHVKHFFGKSADDIYGFFDTFIAEKSNQSHYSKSLSRKYKNVRDKLYKFNSKLSYSDITLDFFYKWTHHLFEIEKLSTNTVARYITFFKSMMNEATERGYNKNLAYQGNKFSIKKAKTIYPYLSIDELDIILKADLPDNLKNSRDNLLIGCYSGLRHSDWHKLNLDHLMKIDGSEFFQVSTEKTKGIVYIPAHDKLKIVVGRKPRSISNQKTNDQIKLVCKEAGINSSFVKISHKGNKMTEKAYEKWELVSTHIARRSFVCNSLISGIPKRVIMNVTGHKSESAFNAYAQLTSLDGMNLFGDLF